MRTTVLYLVLGLSLLFFSIQTNASHVAGGDFQIECMGNDSFLVTFSFYRDCDGIIPQPKSISFKSPCYSNFIINTVHDSVKDVSQLCSSAMGLTQCNGGFLKGLERYYYSTVVELPGCSQGDWTIGTIFNARPFTANITSTGASGLDNFYLETTINTNIAGCNTIPKFNAQPIPYFCKNVPATYNFSVTDKENDSLVYRLATPLNNDSTPVNWNSGYSENSPFSVPIDFDSTNGQISFTPSSFMVSSGLWSIKVCVDEYRNGTLISTNCRDVQFYVDYCSSSNPNPINNAPYLINGISNITGQASILDSNSIQICEGNYFYFDIQFTDSLTQSQSFGDSVSLGFIGDLPSTVNTNIINGDTATLHVSGVIPKESQIQSTFYVFARDEFCDIYGLSYYQFDIKLNKKPDAGEDRFICKAYDSARVSVSNGEKFEWSVINGDPIILGVNFKDTTNTNGENIWASPNSTTTYEVEVFPSSSCNDKDTITVFVGENFSLSTLGDTLVCPADSVFSYQLTASTDTSLAYTYQWSDPNLLDNDSIQSPIASITDDKTFFVTVTGDTGCIKQDSVHIEFDDNMPTQASADQIICKNVDTAFVQTSSGSRFFWSVLNGDPININSNFSDTSGVDGSDVWMKPNSTTTYLVTSNLQSPCSNSDTVKVTVAPNFNLNPIGDTLVCPNDSVHSFMLDANPDSAFNYSFEWSDSSLLNDATSQSPTASIQSSTSFYTTVTSDSGCIKTGSVNIGFALPFPTQSEINFPDSVACLGDTIQTFVDFGEYEYSNCELSDLPCQSAQLIGNIGLDSNAIGGSDYPAPFGNWFASARHQMVYTASEIHNLTNTNQGTSLKLTSFGLDVDQLGNQPVFKNFEIKIGCIADSSLDSGWVGGLHSAYYSGSDSISTGWNNFSFDKYYNWDGVSNIVVEVCFKNGSWTPNGNAYTNTSSTPFTSVRYYASDSTNACSYQQTTGVSSDRPNAQFGYCNGFSNANFEFAWSPGQSISDTSLYNPTIYPTSTTNYQVIIRDTFSTCFDTLSKTINVYSYPVVDLGNDTAVGPNQVISLSSGNSVYANTWNTSENTEMINPRISSDTTFWVSVDNNGCTTTDTIDVFINTGSDQNTLLTDLKVFPNPTKENLNIDVKADEALLYSIFSINGQVIKKGKLTPGMNSFNIRELPASSYQLLIRSNDGIILNSIHIIKQ